MTTEFGIFTGLTDLTPGREGRQLTWTPMAEFTDTARELTPYEQVHEHFDARRYTEAARTLENLLEAEENSPAAERAHHGTTAARLLLARAYYHSAQLHRAEETARGVLATDPTDSYAALLTGRSLQRQGRADEAAPFLRLAELLGEG